MLWRPRQRQRHATFLQSSQSCGPRQPTDQGYVSPPSHNLSLFLKTFAVPPRTPITRIYPRSTTPTPSNVRIAPRYPSPPAAQASLHRRTAPNPVRNRTRTRAIRDARRRFRAGPERRGAHVPWTGPTRRLPVTRPRSYQARNGHSGLYLSLAAYVLSVPARGAWNYTDDVGTHGRVSWAE